MSCINCGGGGRLKSGGACLACYGSSHAQQGHPDQHNTGTFDVGCEDCHSEGKHDEIISQITSGAINRGNVQSAWINYPEPEKMKNQNGTHGTDCPECRKLAGDWYKD